MYADHLLLPWTRELLAQIPDVRLFDVHTHLGLHDPSGFRATEAELLAALSLVDARAVMFPLAEPGGYREANDAVLAAADAEPRLVPFARLSPQDAVAEGRRCVRAGAAGFKLHPASDGFSPFDDRLEPLYAFAERERLPVLVHTGPGTPPLGKRLLDLLTRFPQLRMVLAHAALTDLEWLADRAAEFPTLMFDTSWWSASDLVALCTRVPPGQILLASDLPYSTPVWAVHATLRCGGYAGLGPGQLAGVAGGQCARLVAKEQLLDLGPAPGPSGQQPWLERVHTYLAAAVEATKRGDGPGQTLELARNACELPDTHPLRSTADSVATLLDRYESYAPRHTTGNQYAPGWDLLAAAALLARTPGPPLPTRSTMD
ncbi:amidohydrolase family protein [Amycolatopsis jiangsuensis]|uniref:Amidohydrolase-related domain-containing protein n=1 Tax=Amycolatopsis jiangsuensis TaxID=1181879 RepID=A0A840J000_9PSEU|nr:amidohydrolase family protein [Amycolatopsis jiangsuensis]MBB4686738.1 hypothetical protein [Amycolatopsis jiangsuensis]